MTKKPWIPPYLIHKLNGKHITTVEVWRSNVAYIIHACPFEKASKKLAQLGFSNSVGTNALKRSDGSIFTWQDNFSRKIMNVFYFCITSGLLLLLEPSVLYLLFMVHLDCVKGIFWDFLCQLECSINGPWIILEDFNQVV